MASSVIWTRITPEYHDGRADRWTRSLIAAKSGTAELTTHADFTGFAAVLSLVPRGGGIDLPAELVARVLSACRNLEEIRVRIDRVGLSYLWPTLVKLGKLSVVRLMLTDWSSTRWDSEEFPPELKELEVEVTDWAVRTPAGLSRFLTALSTCATLQSFSLSGHLDESLASLPNLVSKLARLDLSNFSIPRTDLIARVFRMPEFRPRELRIRRRPFDDPALWNLFASLQGLHDLTLAEIPTALLVRLPHVSGTLQLVGPIPSLHPDEFDELRVVRQRIGKIVVRGYPRHARADHQLDAAELEFWKSVAEVVEMEGEDRC